MLSIYFISFIVSALIEILSEAWSAWNTKSQIAQSGIEKNILLRSKIQ